MDLPERVDRGCRGDHSKYYWVYWNFLAPTKHFTIDVKHVDSTQLAYCNNRAFCLLFTTGHRWFISFKMASAQNRAELLASIAEWVTSWSICYTPSISNIATYSLQSNENYSDVTITCKGAVFRAHKTIICPQSLFFRNICKKNAFMVCLNAEAKF